MDTAQIWVYNPHGKWFDVNYELISNYVLCYMWENRVVMAIQNQHRKLLLFRLLQLSHT